MRVSCVLSAAFVVGMTLGAAADAHAAPAVQVAQAEGGYEAHHRDWAVRCGACVYSEEHVCSAWAMSPDPAGERDLSLAFYLDKGTQPLLALDIPMIGAGPVRLAVDEEEPMTLVPPEVVFWAMTGELVLDSEYTTNQLVEAFRAGRDVTVTFSDSEFVTRTPTFSLLGFGAALDDMIARLPKDPPFCEE